MRITNMTLFSACCFIATAFMSTASVQAEEPAPEMNRGRYLLLDKRIIESTDNVKLTLGAVRKDENNPLFSEGHNPWELHYNNPYLSMIYDEEEKLYKVWYSLYIRAPYEDIPADQRAWQNWRYGARVGGVCYATSKDGIKWDKPKLGVVDFDGNKDNNIVLVLQHGVAVIKDLHEKDPQRRYKAILPQKSQSVACFSPDGIHWKQQKIGRIDWGDTQQGLWWDERLQKYVLITRRWMRRPEKKRLAVRAESSDFINWTPTQLVMEGVDCRMQVHDLIVKPYCGIYIGMIGLFDIVQSRQWVELAWSPDSITWHRVEPGKALIPNGPNQGDYDWGCVFSGVPIIRKDEILIYYGGADGRFMGFRTGHVCLAHMRPDGFAGYQQTSGGNNKTGSLTTKPVTALTDRLCISADVAPSGGFVEVIALDENNKEIATAKRINRTVTDKPLEWTKGSFKELKDKKVRLKFVLRQSKIYSFSFQE